MKYLKGVLVFVSVVVIAGCVARESQYPFAPKFQPPDLREGYQQKVENLLVLFDSSASMNGCYFSDTKLDIAKNTICNMLHALPPDIKLDAGLRVFGPQVDKSIHAPGTRLILPVAPLARESMASEVQKFSAGGLTQIAEPLAAAGKDLRDVKGRIAVILISDGIDSGSTGALAQAKALGEEYGSRLCLTTVLVGEDTEGQQLLEKISGTDGCGLVSSAVILESGELMADFVRRVVYERNRVVDSDGDGVPDDRDLCPDTPKGIAVDVNGCPLDSDGDGVPDYRDKCPGTLRGVPVDADGCPPKVAVVDIDVEFDVDKTDVKPGFYSQLEDFADFMVANPMATAIIEGHTDNTGSAEYNLDLSLRRAESVKGYLVENFKIGSWRMKIEGYGLTKPIASNATAIGRQRNRRVMTIVDLGAGR